MFDENEWDYASPRRDRVMTQNVGGVLVVRLLEPQILDESQAGAIYEALEELVREKFKMKIVVDLSRVLRISSLGLGRLVAFHKLVAGQDGAVKLLGVSPAIAQILKASRLDRMFEVFDDEIRAIKSFQKKRKWWG